MSHYPMSCQSLIHIHVKRLRLYGQTLLQDIIYWRTGDRQCTWGSLKSGEKNNIPHSPITRLPCQTFMGQGGGRGGRHMHGTSPQHSCQGTFFFSIFKTLNMFQFDRKCVPVHTSTHKENQSVVAYPHPLPPPCNYVINKSKQIKLHLISHRTETNIVRARISQWK